MTASRFLGISIAVASLLPQIVVAQTPYFSFQPDYRTPYVVTTTTTVEEVFLPLNDHISSFDFIAHDNSADTTITCTLIDLNGVELGTSTVTIGADALVDDGALIHFTLPAQVRVSANLPYRLRISSDSSTLQLMWATSNNLIAYNGPPPPLYSSGTARINDSDQPQSFLYSLYETLERVPPVLTSVNVEHISPTQSVISFNASEPVDRKFIASGIIMDWQSSYSSCVAGVARCSIALTVLPATTYSYTLSVRDSWGNLTTQTGTFTTLGETPAPTTTTTTTPTPTATSTPTPPPDTTGPVITRARVVATTAHSATFAWTTNEAANSSVIAQITPFIITAGWGVDSMLELEHTVTVPSLPADTTYRATITSIDAANNATTTYLTFSTPPETPAPTVSPAPPQTPNPTQQPAVPTIATNPTANTITWNPPVNGEPSAGYRVDVFTAGHQLIRSVTVAPGSHALNTPLNATDRVIIYARDNDVYTKVGVHNAVEAAATTASPSYWTRWLIAVLILCGAIVALVMFRRRQVAPPQTVA